MVVEDLEIFPLHVADESASVVCGADHQPHFIDPRDDALRWAVESCSELLAADKCSDQDQMGR